MSESGHRTLSPLSSCRTTEILGFMRPNVFIQRQGEAAQPWEVPIAGPLGGQRPSHLCPPLYSLTLSIPNPFHVNAIEHPGGGE